MGRKKPQPKKEQQKKQYKLQTNWLVTAEEKTVKEYKAKQAEIKTQEKRLNKLLAIGNLAPKTTDYVDSDLGSQRYSLYRLYYQSLGISNSLITPNSTLLAYFNKDVNSRKTLITKDGLISEADLKALEGYTAELTALENTKLPFSKTQFADIKKGKVPTIVRKNQFKLYYNSSAPREAYFSSQETFKQTNTTGVTSYVMNKDGNLPKRIENSADELWNGSTNHKGMIVPSRQVYMTNTAGNPPQPLKPLNATVDTTFDIKDSSSLYAFQFLYNPGSVQMQYQGTPDVDVSMATSGSDQFALVGGLGVTQSTISFDLLLNRTYDMKYYDDNTHMLKEGIDPKDVYPVWTHTKEEAGISAYLTSQRAQKEIYRKGTMYDLEYLLRGLLGYTAASTLRGGTTADIGYVGATPVELHLGYKMRYLGIITSLSVKHLTFNERMVPLFSSVSLMFSRIPDFPTTEGDNALSAEALDALLKSYDSGALTNAAAIAAGATGRVI